MYTNKHLSENVFIFLYYCAIQALYFNTIEFSFVSIPTCLMFGMDMLPQRSTLFEQIHANWEKYSWFVTYKDVKILLCINSLMIDV